MAKQTNMRKQRFYKMISKAKVFIEEIFPFLFFYFRKRKQTKEVNNETFACENGPYKDYYQLTEEDLKSRIAQEHERSKSMDDKTFKMTLAISFGLTILGLTASLLIKGMPDPTFSIIVVIFSSLSIFYSMAAGFTAIGALKTLPTYGYGTDFIIKGEEDKSVLVHALSSQEKMNIIRHLRNESAYQSLRNSMLSLFLALVLFTVSLISYYFESISLLKVVC
jgi:hypothetical protein